MQLTRKLVLLLAMVLSVVPVVLAIDPQVDFVDSSSRLYLAARQWGLIATLVIWWQFLLGVRDVVSKLVPDLVWVNNLHKLLGKYGFLAILLHPVLIFIHYSELGVNIIGLNLSSSFDIYKFLGVLAFQLVLFVWVVSALLRGKVSFRWWKRVHLLVYFAGALALLHGMNIGLTLATNQNLRMYWYSLIGVAVLVFVLRLTQAAGLTKLRYSVEQVVKLTLDTNQLILLPRGRSITPAPGQFVYLQLRPWGEAHPFTVSHFDQDSGELRLSIKATGKFSQQVANLKPGERVFLQGPYGVFTREAYSSNHPVVFIAGGIGITPFLRPIQDLNTSEKFLLWGNKTEADITFAQELGGAQNLTWVNVLSNQSDYRGEKGYITAELLEKYLDEDLTKYEFFVCGPPVMMSLVEKLFKLKGVPLSQQHFEKFSL